MDLEQKAEEHMKNRCYEVDGTPPKDQGPLWWFTLVRAMQWDGGVARCTHNSVCPLLTLKNRVLW